LNMKQKEQKISGGYLINKPQGITSRQVDNRIGRLLRTRRVGHIGTLDPLAEGLIPVLVGYSTRIAPFLDSGIKAYRGEISLGITTDTDDSEGEIIERHPVDISVTKIFEVLKSFLGEIAQVPPKFSAKKIDGVRMYKRARRGEDFVIQPKKVTVYSIENVEIDMPKVRFDIECGTGTYLRAIARDLGNILGCGGHLSALLRTRVGPHIITDAVTLDNVIESIEKGEPKKYLLTNTELIPHIPCVRIDGMKVWRVSQGQIIPRLGSQFQPGQLFAIIDPHGNIIAIAESVNGAYRYRRVLAGN